MYSCDSKAIEQYDYEPDNKVLIVHFKSGAKGRYQNVSQETFDAFHEAPSKGSHFHQHIRNAHEYERA